MAVAIGLLLVASCKKTDYPDDIFDHGKKEPFLQEMIHGTRHYLFYYDNKGFVDSIRAVDAHTTYLYRVVHHGKRIDSVSLIQNGAVVSTHGNIQYDNKGRIIQYTYFLRAFPEAPPAVISLTYEQGHIKTITQSGFIESSDTLAFNPQHNLVRWVQKRLHAPFVETSFTYDLGLNPLYYIDDLFVMFTEETFFWEFIFSRHNSTRKEVQSTHTQVTDYVNQYDTYGRLLKKRMQENMMRDSLEFRYFH